MTTRDKGPKVEGGKGKVGLRKVGRLRGRREGDGVGGPAPGQNGY